jgi:electron transfer flavoprotein alpha subunit
MTARINPKCIDFVRPLQTSLAGLKRVVLAPVSKAVESHPPKPIRTPAKPKNHLLVIAHSIKGALDDHALQTIAAAAILADTETAVTVLILGVLQQDLLEKLGTAGADEVMVLPTLDFQIFQPDVELATILDVIKSLNPSRIFMPDNTIGDGDLGRRLIAHMQLTAATHVVEMDAKHVANYQAGGSLLAQCELPQVILLAPNTVDVELPFTAKARHINPPKIADNTSQYQDLGLQNSTAEDIALEEADFIVSAGNGVANLTTLAKLADALGASVGASRMVVDDGKLPRNKQIGASGKTVTASTYMAVGISGAVQHLQGIKDCRHVIAINKDASAPMVKRADLSIIGDAEAIMQALISEINHSKQVSK